MYAPVIVGSCGNRSSYFRSYIFQVFVGQHGQVAGDSMTQLSELRQEPASIESPANIPTVEQTNLPQETLFSLA